MRAFLIITVLFLFSLNGPAALHSVNSNTKDIYSFMNENADLSIEKKSEISLVQQKFEGSLVFQEDDPAIYYKSTLDHKKIEDENLVKQIKAHLSLLKFKPDFSDSSEVIIKISCENAKHVESKPAPNNARVQLDTVIDSFSCSYEY